MASDFELNVSVQNYESDILFDLNEIPSEEEEESVTNGYEDIPISPAAATIPQAETPLTSRNSANPNPNPKRSSIPARGDGTFDRLMEEAVEEIEAASSSGDPHSQSLMGFVYGTGMMREKSKRKSFLRHNFAAEGRLFLNATSGSHFYFDDEVIASQTLFDELCATNVSDSTSGTEYGGVQRLETVSLAELNAYVLTSPHKYVF
ncbi:hypothetical protein YC2023_116316 [Brassica napus]